MDWPLIERELARRERSRRTYWLRFAVGGVAFVYLLFLGAIEAMTAVNPERIGNALTAIGSAFQFGAAMFLPLILTADLVAREKQERTLGLLVLADPSGFGVYGAKFLSAFLPTALLILAALPVLAIAAPFGGIDVSSLAVNTLLYLVAAFAVTAIGMLTSVYAWQPGPAFFNGLFSVIALTVVLAFLPRFFNYSALNPLSIAWRGGIEPHWWIVALSTVAVGSVLVAAGLRLLPRMAHDKPIPRRSLREWVRGKPTARAVHPRREPAQQLLARRLGGWTASIRPWPLRVLASIGLIVMGFLTCIGPILLVVLIAWDILSALRAGRESGAIDDVRLTADDAASIPHWIYRSQVRRSMFYFPAMLFAGGLGTHLYVFGFPAMRLFPGPAADLAGVPVLFIFMLGAAIAFTVVQLRLIVALACRAFLRSSLSQASAIGSVVGTYILYLIASSIVVGLLGLSRGFGADINGVIVIALVFFVIYAAGYITVTRFVAKFEDRF